ncbi:hypothetical protein [Pseudomonas sp. NFX98]|uniref:hypothetical protein n=1 Tax=Pseudomonas sp. NFX98 TaxID=3399122 RepID=UPI0039FBD2CB
MQLDEVELFALEHLFDASNTGNPVPAVNADHYRVQERAITTAGFFSILKCIQPSGAVPPIQETCKPFSHPRLRKGGVFICWVESDLTICLEGVAERKKWPSELLPLALHRFGNHGSPLG